MLNIGAHLSSSKGYLAMGETALSINANTFQFFTRNPRGGTAKAFNITDASALSLLLKEHSFAPIMAHAPYTMNFAAKDEALRQFCVNTMKDDLYRLAHIDNAMYNLHPGSHTGQGHEIGIQLIANTLNEAVTSDIGPPVLLETMAGGGTQLGSTFKELSDIISLLKHKNRFYICLDTCHVYDSGYNIADNLQAVLDELDRVLGISKLKAVHLNDSMHGLSSRKDRHAKIGEGQIGLTAFEKIINNTALRSLPFYLETPNELSGYKSEIALLRKAYKE